MKDILVQIPEKHKDSLWSWVVCVCSFCVQFVAFGFHNSFGTFFVALLDKYGKSESATAWVGAMAIGLTFLLGPFATYLCNHMGCRITACTGSLLVLISAVSTSIVNEIKWMYLTFSLLNGLGSSMLYFSSLVVLIEYFQKHLSLANGIVLSGSGIGTLCITLMSQNLISNYGLSMTYRVIGGLYVICFFAGLTFTPVRTHNEDISTETKKASNEEVTPLSGRWKKCFKIGDQWKNKGFIVWTGATAVVLFAYYIPSMYIVSIAKGIGVPTSKGGLLVGFLAIAHTIGKIVIGKVADLPGVNRLTVLQLGLLVSAVVTCLLPLAKSFEMLIAYSCVQGFCDGSFGVLIGLVTHDVVGKKLMADAIGCLYLVVALPMTLGPPVAGMFYDHLGSYNAVFFLSSALVCTGICLMFAVPWLVPASLPEKEDLLVMDNYNDSFHDSEEHYDMSYVDERKIADLFGRKKARNLLLDRASLRNSIPSTRASSFVLFSIVSEEQQRDISAYTSRQELSLLSGANSPIRGTPSTRKRHLDAESRTSMYSLWQSSVNVAHGELHAGQDNADQEHVSIPFETALETVEEAAEFERKVSCEERQPLQQPKLDRSSSIEIVNEETDVTDGDLIVAKEYFTRESEEETNHRPSWSSESNNSLKSSGTQLSEGTVDSGFVDTTWLGSSEVDSRYSVQNFIECTSSTAEVIPRSYSWSNILAPSHDQPLATSTSQEYIDYVVDSTPTECTTSCSELGRDYSDAKTECIEDLLPTKGSFPYLSPEGYIGDEYNLEIEKVQDLCHELNANQKLENELGHGNKEVMEDVYSMEVERALDLAEQVEESLKYDNSGKYFSLKEDFRETFV